VARSPCHQVEKIIDEKQETDGGSGVAYLMRALEVFPELWQVRTDL
jgi:tryptophan 2,3-dioxygenase